SKLQGTFLAHARLSTVHTLRRRSRQSPNTRKKCTTPFQGLEPPCKCKLCKLQGTFLAHARLSTLHTLRRRRRQSPNTRKKCTTPFQGLEPPCKCKLVEVKCIRRSRKNSTLLKPCGEKVRITNKIVCKLRKLAVMHIIEVWIGSKPKVACIGHASHLNLLHKYYVKSAVFQIQDYAAPTFKN
ncbi:Queuine tRNA-ribosyltransferase, partial [Frankliniella fusca]